MSRLRLDTKDETGRLTGHLVSSEGTVRGYLTLTGEDTSETVPIDLRGDGDNMLRLLKGQMDRRWMSNRQVYDQYALVA